MRKRNRLQAGEDMRAVAIYARKSRITNKGDSIGVQFKQSGDYAINQLSLPEDYPFLNYEDKGLSGYYSDRPDFQRLLHDIDRGKIRAVACYKLDRISRKTSDLMRLLEYFEKHNVTLLVCSNNINTQISTSKIIIQVLAIIAEFERDILTERIQDNLMELAKDGRWMGGTTPTGFEAKRVTTGSGKNKSAVSFLVTIPEEKQIIKKLFSIFLATRSLNATATILNQDYTTKNGAAFTTLAVKDILKNPIYCTADETSYQYLLDQGANMCGNPEDYNGMHGLSAYNKTDQMILEDDNSTFFNPKFVRATERKPIEQWIVSVGQHEGFIPSVKWIAAQRLLADIAERYNRPHRKTNALLSGVLRCPLCGRPLRVVPESNRWTNGKPRFKYVCPGFRKKECHFKAVDGVEMDEYIVEKLAELSNEHSEYYREVFLAKLSALLHSDPTEAEYRNISQKIDKLQADIAAQVRNLREADASIRKFIQEDIASMSQELQKQESALQSMREERGDKQKISSELEIVRQSLISFSGFAKTATPEVLVTLIQSLVDRIYVVTDNNITRCHIYLKGCVDEDYSEIIGVADYISLCAILIPVATLMCDCDRGRERHSHLCRGATAYFLCGIDEKTRI